MSRYVSRRTILRGAGVALALPWLESLLPRDVRAKASELGFGMGVERCVSWICGLEHVRETIPYPRMLYRLYP